MAKILGAIIGATVIGCWTLMYPTTTYRFRITLTTETPQGVKTGTSVMKVRSVRYPAWMTLSSSGVVINQSIEGEAIFIAIGLDGSGKQQNLIALLSTGTRGEGVDFYGLPQSAFAPIWKERIDAFGPNGSLEKQRKFPFALDIPLELSRLSPGTNTELYGKLIPTLVTFTDINDPKTVQVVQPHELDQVFGKGTRFSKATIEIVSAGTWPLTLFGMSGEPVTRGIETKMPEIVRRLRSQSHELQIDDIRKPFNLRLGHLIAN